MSEQIPLVDLKTGYREMEDDILRRVKAVFEHGQYIMGPEVKELEEKLADYVGVDHCIAASSGTDTLLMAMMAVGVKAGDEIITTPFTFISTVETIALIGARPVFVDIDPVTYNIDPAAIQDAISDRTRAIMPVSLYGQPADFNEINAIANDAGLPVIEDAAQSFGAEYNGQKSCGISSIGSTSFFPSKPLGCYGDGGALFTSDEALAEKFRRIRAHGQSKRYHHVEVGLNARLDTVQAAILLAKLERFDREVHCRQVAANRYTEGLAGLDPDRLVLPAVRPDRTSVFAQYTLLVDDREALAAKLKEKGVPTSVHYPVPLHMQPAFLNLGYAKGDFPKSEYAADRVLSLPMGPDILESHQARVIDEIARALA